MTSPRSRAREVDLIIGELLPGPHNAVTDVAGVRVGHTTLIGGEGNLQPGLGPVRTGVTVILPHEGNIYRSLFCAETIVGRDDHVAYALPVDKVLKLMQRS